MAFFILYSLLVLGHDIGSRAGRLNGCYMNEELRMANRGRRKAERRMRNTNLSVHQQMYREIIFFDQN